MIKAICTAVPTGFSGGELQFTATLVIDGEANPVTVNNLGVDPTDALDARSLLYTAIMSELGNYDITDPMEAVIHTPFDIPKCTVLGHLHGASFNTTADQEMKMSAACYRIEHIMFYDASGTPTLAVGGIYTQPNKGGTAVVPATQVYSSLTNDRKFLMLTPSGSALTECQISSSLYLSLTTAQGAAMTGNICVIGEDLK